MKVAIIGGGASGIIASIKAQHENDVTLFEGNDKTLKKLLLTGNGKCNYWNESISYENYNTDNVDNLKCILERKDEVYNFLYNLGIYPTIKNGLYYPNSLNSNSVKTLLDNSLKNVNIKYNSKVESIIKEGNVFKIRVNNEDYEFDKVIIATGSKAMSKTGSNGSGYKMLEDLGYNINKVLPSLVQVKTNGSFLNDWDGVRTNVSLKLYINDELVKEEKGEIQLTNYGISGICVFNISSYISKAINDNKKVRVYVNFFNEDFKKFMDNRNVENDSISCSLETVFNYKLSNIFYKICKIDKNKTWKLLSEEEKISLSNLINNFELEVIGTNDYDKAQVCTGGLSLSEINPRTMQLNKIPGMYVIGELLDADGICGGFNLGFAFITGFIAGELND